MAGKICVFCGEDCATRPRVKDEQGRYACKACAERRPAPRRAVPQASKPAPLDDALDNDDFGLDPIGVGLEMDDLLDGAQIVDPNPCPACGKPRAAGAVVCMECGFNAASGERVSTVVSKSRPKKERAAPVIQATWAVPLVFIGAVIAFPVIATTSESLAVTAWIMTAIWLAVANIMMLVAAFKDGDTKWGVIGLCSYIPVIGGLAGLAFLLYYCIFGSERTTWKLNLWCAIFAVIAVVAVLLTKWPSAIDEVVGMNEM